MKQFYVTAENYNAEMLNAWNEVVATVENGTVKVTVETDEGIGKWGMSRLWRSWMGVTAQFMAAHGITQPLMIKANGEHYGVRPFKKEDAHELFTSQWLGLDANGNRLSWSRSSDNRADKGQRFSAMLKHEQYMSERGIKYLIPRSSEYFTEKTKTES